ncbi:MAG TPA: histidinol-phosphate transaminase [Euzebyales bacterium]|nr:histidinol-phosphate transaminase [Euzebyales bacterium]
MTVGEQAVTRVPARDDLAGIAPYGAPQLDVAVRLNTNETPYPPPPEFFARLAERLPGLPLQRYPDRRATALRTAIGERFGRPVDGVWAAKGSNEILLQLFQAYGGPGRRLLLADPGYSAHPLIALSATTDVVHVELGADFTLDPEAAAAAASRHDPHVICLASPHNPAGTLVASDVVRAAHDASRALVVIDEAYIEFAPGGGSAVELLDELPRLVVCRTFSKAWRLAGLRLGYLLAPPWVIDDLRKVRLPYHLDAITQQAGLVALEMAAAMTAHIAAISDERAWLTDRLRSLPQLTVFPSSGNFLLVRSARPGLFDRLLEHGVLVRDFSHVRGLDGCVRITVGTREEHTALLEALRRCL